MHLVAVAAREKQRLWLSYILVIKVEARGRINRFHLAVGTYAHNLIRQCRGASYHIEPAPVTAGGL